MVISFRNMDHKCQITNFILNSKREFLKFKIFSLHVQKRNYSYCLSLKFISMRSQASVCVCVYIYKELSLTNILMSQLNLWKKNSNSAPSDHNNLPLLWSLLIWWWVHTPGKSLGFLVNYIYYRRRHLILKSVRSLHF